MGTFLRTLLRFWQGLYWIYLAEFEDKCYILVILSQSIYKYIYLESIYLGFIYCRNFLVFQYVNIIFVRHFFIFLILMLFLKFQCLPVHCFHMKIQWILCTDTISGVIHFFYLATFRWIRNLKIAIQFLANGQVKQHMSKVLGPSTHTERPRWSSWLLTSVWSNSSCWNHLGSKLADRKYISLSLTLDFKYFFKASCFHTEPIK